MPCHERALPYLDEARPRGDLAEAEADVPGREHGRPCRRKPRRQISTM